MAVVSVNEWFERGGRDSARSTREHYRTFIVVTDSASDDETVIGAHEDIPQFGEEHPNDSLTLVAERDCEPYQAEDSRLVWIVRVRYSSGVRFGNGDKWRWLTSFNNKISDRGFFYSPGTPDPEGGPPTGGGWSNVKIPYLTSALGRFKQPPEYDEPYRILQVQRGATLLAYYAAQQIIDAALHGSDGQGTVNQNDFTYQTKTYLPGEVRFMDCQEDLATPDESSNAYVSLTFTFACRRGGWFDDILDEDVAALVTETRTINGNQVQVFRRAPILKAQPGAGGGMLGGAPPQEEITEPIPLDGNGRELVVETLGGDIPDVASIPFVYMRYRKYDPFPYELIGF